MAWEVCVCVRARACVEDLVVCVLRGGPLRVSKRGVTLTFSSANFLCGKTWQPLSPIRCELEGLDVCVCVDLASVCEGSPTPVSEVSGHLFVLDFDFISV